VRYISKIRPTDPHPHPPRPHRTTNSATAAKAKYGDESVYFDLGDVESTTGAWDVYGEASTARYPGQQEAFFEKGAFVFALVPIRPRSRGERRSLRTFSPGARFSPPRAPRSRSRHTSTPFNSASDAFQLHPDIIARTERPKAAQGLGRREAMYSFLALAGPAACLVFGGKGAKDAKLPITVGPQKEAPLGPRDKL
jgi:hypothetical protein